MKNPFKNIRDIFIGGYTSSSACSLRLTPHHISTGFIVTQYEPKQVHSTLLTHVLLMTLTLNTSGNIESAPVSTPPIPLLSESCAASSHDLTLADQLCIEFGTIEREVDIEVNSVEGALWSIHPFKVFL